MAVLHIEHPITDYDTWRSAFDGFADARAAAGVLRHNIQRPIDDDAYIVVDLTFETSEKAQEFLSFLRTVVWASRTASPALAGDPVGKVLIPA